MSQENVEVVRRFFELTNSRAFAAAMEAYADDVVLVFHGATRNLAGTDRVSGKTGVGDWFGDWFRTFARDYQFEIDESRDVGDRVLIVVTHHGRGRASGAPSTGHTAEIIALRNGKIVRWDMYPSRDDAIEAAGLRE